MPRPSKPHLHRGFWRCTIDGQFHHLGADKRRAWQQFHKLMAGRNREAPDGRPQTINGAIVAWLKVNDRPGYGNWLNTFRSFAGLTYLDEIERDLLTRYHLHLKGRTAERRTWDRKAKRWAVMTTDQPLADRTVRHYVRTAAAVLKWAQEQGWLETMPIVPKLPRPVRKARDLKPEAVAEALDDMTGRSKRAGQILRFIAATGCRPSEACRLQWADVHLERGLCVLAQHKTAKTSGRPRTIYLTPDADQVLREVLAERTRLTIGQLTGPVFKTIAGHVYSPAGLRSILRRHAGGATPYQLRHTFAQAGSETGLPADVLAKLLGHSSTQTTAFYYEVRDARAVAAAQSLRPMAPKAAEAG